MCRPWDLRVGTHSNAGWEEKQKGYLYESPWPRLVGCARRIGSRVSALPGVDSSRGGRRQGKSRPRGTEARWLSAIHPPALSASHCVPATQKPRLFGIPPPHIGQEEVRGRVRGSEHQLGGKWYTQRTAAEMSGQSRDPPRVGPSGRRQESGEVQHLARSLELPERQLPERNRSERSTRDGTELASGLKAPLFLSSQGRRETVSSGLCLETLGVAKREAF